MDRCILCGRPENKAHFMVKGPDGEKAFCNNCISMLSIIANQAYMEMDEFSEEHDSFNEEEKAFEEAVKSFEEEIEDDIEDEIEDYEPSGCFDEEITPEKKKLYPHDIMEILNKHVIGQDKAKKTLAVAVYNHIKRLNDKTGRIKKSNIMMLGPSGTGKTLLAKTLADMLDVPFAIADATSLTQAGYVGDDVENILVRLIQAAEGDIEKAERGIVYIDEIDKIARKGENRSISRDVSGEGVQHALLKIIEGADVSVPLGGGRKHPIANNIMINTDKILFICGGAFEGLEIKSQKKSNAIGFGTSAENKEPENEKDDTVVSAEKLVSYGMTPELMGRLPVIVQLDDLKEDDLVRILTEPEFSLTKEYEALLQQDNVELIFEEDALREIAKIALERHIGARGLRSIMEDLMLDIMFDVPSEDEKIRKCIITKETVLNKQPVIEAA